MQAKTNLATAYWLQGQKDEAQCLLEGLFGEFKNTMLYGNLGYFTLLLGDLEAALVINKDAYDYNDNDLTIMDNLAQNYYLLGRMKEAEEMYVKVIAKEPKHAESYYYLQTLQKLGKVDEAREQIGKALERKLALVTPLTREDIEQASVELNQVQ